MTTRPRDCVLIEFLGNGTRPEDARERARAVAGRGGRAFVVGDRDDAGDDAPPPIANTDRAEWLDAARAALAESPGATLLLAGDEAIEERPRFDGLAADVRAWPTHLCGDPRRDPEALACAIAAQVRVSSRDSLWDGDYVVVPGVPDHAAIELVIEAFALVAEAVSSIELVFLGDRVAPLDGLAADLGLPWRVHWVGASPLRAECTWLAGASSIVLTDREAADPALALRALASGAALHVAGDGPRARHLHPWLAGCGVTSAHALGRESLADALVRSAMERSGRFLAAAAARLALAKHDPGAALDRLLGPEPAMRPAQTETPRPRAA